MRVVILAGGYGSRMGPETVLKPKPMVEVGGKPVLVHLMDSYEAQGFHDFVVLGGYKCDCIVDWFRDEALHAAKAVEFQDGSCRVLEGPERTRRVVVVDTGVGTPTCDRLALASKFIGKGPFLLTYGDGLSDVNISATIDKLNAHPEALALVTAYQPRSQFGGMVIDTTSRVLSFREKSSDSAPWVNAGFLVLKEEAMQYLVPGTMLEESLLPKLAKAGKLVSYRHHGKWVCMDTVKDKEVLEEEWQTGDPFWYRRTARVDL